MKSALGIFLFLVTGMAAQAGTVSIKTVGDIAVMQQNADGSYMVVCANGNREIDRDLDIKLNNVCPNQKSTTPTHILSLQRRADGSFDVVCNDLTKLVATTAEVVAGTVCEKKAPPPSSVLNNGVYKAVSGDTNYCPHQITTHMNGTTLTGVTINFINPCNAVSETTCQGNLCSGTLDGSATTLQVVDTTHYVFQYHNGDGEATFQYQP
jgi:hypothetical protein